ncbi:cytochrome C oxidase biogenesis Cmc1-like protein [Phanerochaete sordida]|uniref:COX assembly mitochondrial protein n=1 Tax=Phanerochaete sordida TaxID=48140 RepID=A0A9P3L8Z2_9APHY|nr:cytochrome C oxidase biogenesis Cmc1-like protein [Phanerochaete sordida]
MDTALSRREEEALVKTTKEKALKECDPVVKAFAECATGRTVSVAWACRSKYKAVQDCMAIHNGPERLATVREEYLRLRHEQNATKAAS